MNRSHSARTRKPPVKWFDSWRRMIDDAWNEFCTNIRVRGATARASKRSIYWWRRCGRMQPKWKYNDCDPFDGAVSAFHFEWPRMCATVMSNWCPDATGAISIFWNEAKSMWRCKQHSDASTEISRRIPHFRPTLGHSIATNCFVNVSRARSPGDNWRKRKYS